MYGWGDICIHECINVWIEGYVPAYVNAPKLERHTTPITPETSCPVWPQQRYSWQRAAASSRDLCRSLEKNNKNTNNKQTKKGKKHYYYYYYYHYY